MTNDNKNPTHQTPNQQEAKEALAAIKKLEHAGLKRAAPSAGFSVLLSFLIGCLVFLVSAGLREFYVFPILALPLIVSLHYKKSGASVKYFPSQMIGTVSLITLIALMLLLIVSGRLLNDLYGLSWAPVLSGIIAGIVIFILARSERRKYLGKRNGDHNQ